MENENIVKEEFQDETQETQTEESQAQDKSEGNKVFEKLEDMSADEIKEAVKAGEITADDVKEYSEYLEALNKTAQAKIDPKDEQIVEDRVKKIEKLRSKNRAAQQEVAGSDTELTPDDIYTLREQGIKKGSEEEALVLEFKQLPRFKDKDISDILEDKVVKTALDEIKAEKQAQAELDENSDEDARMRTKNEIYERYQESGKEPKSEHEKKVIVEKELEKISEVPLD